MNDATLTLTYCTMDMPSNEIKRIYRTLHEHNISHDVEQNKFNNSVYTIRCKATKKTYDILKELGFKK